MDTDNTYPTPSDILENKEKNSLLYFALNKKVDIRTKREYNNCYTGILKKIQGDFVLLEKEEKKKIIHTIISIDDISTIEIVTLKK